MIDKNEMAHLSNFYFKDSEFIKSIKDKLMLNKSCISHKHITVKPKHKRVVL